LIEQPAVLGVRSVALELLEKTAQARQLLGPVADPEAVHDFRVALRRLRSWERAFRPELESSVPRKIRRRLKALAQAANPSRDTAVHLQWLHEQILTLTPSEHVGVAWLIESLEQAIRVSDTELLGIVDHWFAGAYRRLKRGLKVVPAKRVGRHAPRFGDVVAKRIVDQVEVVRDRLAAVRTVADWREIHTARIAGKRLRYMLEPVAPYVLEVDPILDQLKRLQDLAGDLHDVHVFANDIVAAAQVGAAAYARQLTLAVVKGDVVEAAQAQRENPTPGVLAVAARLRERGARCFEELRWEWLGEGMGGKAGTEELVGLVEGVAARIRRC
jgi:CHAD domain-containing protein